MKRVPYNGYLEIWLQRVTQPKSVGIDFKSNEPICQIVNGVSVQLWESSWISCQTLIEALYVKQIVISDVKEVKEVIEPEEVKLFKEHAWLY
ncbi:MAG TPA: hypothetical protein ENN07_04230 [candidate division Zixibacteria bacterium]|nr:hypothetical protein [candidate division Zixibacteria bacterium]